jgi:hypothetical protein
MRNERIDETIDRVAAELTAVSPNAGFATRLLDRLQRPQRRSVMSILVLVSATATLFVAVLLMFDRGPAAQPEAVLGRTLDTAPVELLPGGLVGSVSADLAVMSNQAHVLPALPSVDNEDAAIPGGPGALEVEALTIEPMEFPVPTDIVPLDVPNLLIGEIAAGEGVSGKEPK